VTATAAVASGDITGALGKLGITDEKLAEIILSRMVGRPDIPTTHDATPVTGQ
jgi:hypothetical protein